jgi:hypothetical protein
MSLPLSKPVNGIEKKVNRDNTSASTTSATLATTSPAF